MPALTTHVLDTAKGCPAARVPVRLERLGNGAWSVAATGATDEDGRLRLLEEMEMAEYRLVFQVSAYLGAGAFFPEIAIHFTVRDARHHHVPLLLSPFSYSTYRGS